VDSRRASCIRHWPASSRAQFGHAWRALFLLWRPGPNCDGHGAGQRLWPLRAGAVTQGKTRTHSIAANGACHHSASGVKEAIDSTGRRTHVRIALSSQNGESGVARCGFTSRVLQAPLACFLAGAVRSRLACVVSAVAARTELRRPRSRPASVAIAGGGCDTGQDAYAFHRSEWGMPSQRIGSAGGDRLNRTAHERSDRIEFSKRRVRRGAMWIHVTRPAFATGLLPRGRSSVTPGVRCFCCGGPDRTATATKQASVCGHCGRGL